MKIILKPVFIIAIALSIVLVSSVQYAYADPTWIEDVHTWYDSKLISGDELRASFVWLQSEGIIKEYTHMAHIHDEFDIADDLTQCLFDARVDDNQISISEMKACKAISKQAQIDLESYVIENIIIGAIPETVYSTYAVEREAEIKANEDNARNYLSISPCDGLSDDALVDCYKVQYPHLYEPQEAYVPEDEYQSWEDCTGEFPYRWSDGNCWDLPQDYETQTQLGCPDGHPYMWSDGNCYNIPECTGSYPYRGSDGQCYNVPECTTEFPYLWDDNQCYNLPQDYEEQLGCPSDHPYEWSNGNCYNLQECIYPYSYRWDDGQCYNQPPQLSCVDNHAYDTGYGYCCPNNMYTTGNGMCEFIQACPDGYWETNYGDCCPNGTFDPGDGSCRYP